MEKFDRPPPDKWRARLPKALQSARKHLPKVINLAKNINRLLEHDIAGSVADATVAWIADIANIAAMLFTFIIAMF